MECLGPHPRASVSSPALRLTHRQSMDVNCSTVTPQGSCVLQCPCCDSAYRYTAVDMSRGVPKRNPLCQKKQQRGKMDGALLIAASLVAAIRMRGAEIRDSPKLNSTLYDSITLARMVVISIRKAASLGMDKQSVHNPLALPCMC
jgi:hypothetical protein